MAEGASALFEETKQNETKNRSNLNKIAVGWSKLLLLSYKFWEF